LVANFCEGSAHPCETKPQLTTVSARSFGCLEKYERWYLRFR
jgi:hypothetical protein